MSISQDAGTATHVLDPLSESEIETCVAVAREAVEIGPRTRFVAISTLEPARGEESPRRRAEVLLHHPEERSVVRLIVDLPRREATSVETLAGVEPAIGLDEVERFEAAMRADPRFREALRRRGIEDPAMVDIDPVPVGWYGREEEDVDRRLARVLAYVRPTDPASNAYAHPLEGLFGLVDLQSGEILVLEDRDPVPLPPGDGEYRAEKLELREDVKPIHIHQPEGPSFEVDGYAVRWQKWHLRVGFSSREGLVLHEIGYEEDGVVRPILRRASIAEMVVPYADPDRFYQSPLDIGELNVGTMTNSLTLGCDCLGAIHYFDVATVAADGSPTTIPQAICMHEEDDGILWKHSDFRTGTVEVRRGRRLVISSIVTVGNYEYGFFWYLQQDGMIQCEIKATGIVATQARAENEPTEFGKLVAPHLNAIHHQHIFCARLDFELDGGPNSVTETHTEALPKGPENPHGNAWRTVSRTFATEREAIRDLDLTEARSWTVVNPESKNAVGAPVGYRLLPGENTVPFATPDSSLRSRAGFINHHLWVTPYSPDERYPAGEFPYQHRGGDGLPRWTEADRQIESTDVVVWYTMNHHHVPRPEDWPVMPVARLGFMLKPWGFFDRNPGLDVPPTEKGQGSCHA
ncbi:MAG TPA: primary-amine oxidase [Solirubrobacterales bacterium]|jgi:primary-amine oxidase